MPHISKQWVKKDVFIRINDQLIKAIIEVNDYSKARKFFSGLLTYTEKIMLAKRLAIIILLDRGVSIYKLAKTLKMSPSTLARFEQNTEDGKYKDVVSVFKKHSKAAKILEEIGNLILMGMPPRAGKRWGHIFKKL